MALLMDPAVFVTSTRQVAHFESLGDLGVWQEVSGGVVLPADTGPILQGPHHLGVIQQSTSASNLITEIQKAATTDSYLSGMLQSVMDSDDNLFRDFFLDVRETLCSQRVEDARPRVCVPAVCREAVLRAEHTSRPCCNGQTLCHTRFTGQVCTQMSHILCAHVKRVLHQKTLIINVWGRKLISQCLYNHSQAGPWTRLD